MPEILSGNAVIIICVIMGAGLIVLEALTPGLGFPGVTGTALLLLGSYLMWYRHGLTAGLITLFVSLLLSSAAVIMSLKSASKGKLSKSKLILNETTPAQDIAEEATLVGLTGKTLTALSPVGDAEIDGKRYEVLSASGYIQKGESVKVIATEGRKISVEKA